MHRVGVCTVVGLLLCATQALSAQNTRWGRCMVGVSYSAPLKLAVSYAHGRVYESPEGGADVCNYVSGKLGIGGARLMLGTSRTINTLGGGAGASVGLMRTFRTPLHATESSNYAGVTVHLLPAVAFGGELGYFVRVGGVSGPSRRLFTWSAGFGF